MIVRPNSLSQHYTDLSIGQLYFVIGIEANDYRLLNDNGKPYLYPSEIFEIIDGSYPTDWVTKYGEDREQYSYPPPLHQIGFFEDFFDHKPEQTSIFWHIVNQSLAKAA